MPHTLHYIDGLSSLQVFSPRIIAESKDRDRRQAAAEVVISPFALIVINTAVVYQIKSVMGGVIGRAVQCKRHRERY